jgi:DNA-binding transcriptional LysR family regulator
MLNISQPALSAQLKELEKNLNAPLFVRTGRNLKLTPLGRKIYSITRQMFTFASQIPTIAAATVNSQEKILKIGVTDEVEFPYVAGLVCDQQNAANNSFQETIKVVRCTHEESVRFLQNGNLDLTFAGRFPRNHSGLFVRHFELPVYLISQYGALSAAERNFNDVSANEVSRKIELFDWDLVLPTAGSIIREETDSFMARKLIRKHIRFESSSIASIIRAVAEGMGIGFLPGVYCEDAIRLKRVQMSGPKQGFWKSSLVVVARESSNTKRLAKILSERIQQFNLGRL